MTDLNQPGNEGKFANLEESQRELDIEILKSPAIMRAQPVEKG